MNDTHVQETAKLAVVPSVTPLLNTESDPMCGPGARPVRLLWAPTRREFDGENAPHRPEVNETRS